MGRRYFGHKERTKYAKEEPLTWNRHPLSEKKRKASPVRVQGLRIGPEVVPFYGLPSIRKK